MTSRERRALRAGIQTVHDEADGGLYVSLFCPSNAADVDRLATDVVAGSPVAATLLRATVAMAERTAEAPPGRGPLCVYCPTELADLVGGAVGIAVPGRANPSTALTFLLCRTCMDAVDLNQRVATGMRRIWPDARCVTVHPHGGHA